VDRTEITAQMLEIWTKVLRLDGEKASSLTDDSDFFEYGGTSLMIGIMNIMMTQRFGRTVSPEMFYDGATFGRMVDGVFAKEADNGQ
jgi:acyl carrier protein